MAIAGVGTKPANDWIDASGNIWLTGVQTPGIGLYAYEHNISKSDPNLWQSLAEHGQNLLQSLLSLIDNQHVWTPTAVAFLTAYHHVVAALSDPTGRSQSWRVHYQGGKERTINPTSRNSTS